MYSQETEGLLYQCKLQGFNVWPMLALFKRRSGLAPAIPEVVIKEVCNAYLGRMRDIRADFPYFLKVLENKSREYFANQQVKEHIRLRKEPMAFKDILREILK